MSPLQLRTFAYGELLGVQVQVRVENEREKSLHRGKVNTYLGKRRVEKRLEKGKYYGRGK